MTIRFPVVGPNVATWANDMRRYLSRNWDRLTFRTNDQTASDDGIILWNAQKGYPEVSLGGEWREVVLGNSALDFGVRQAEAEIEATFGDAVSVIQKKKTLFKFGNNADLDIADGFATVWQLGKEAGTENEVYPAEGTNPIDSISSTDVGDVINMNFEGHVSNGLTGADEQFTFTSGTVMLNGQNRVALPTALARVSRLSVDNGVSAAGDVYVYENTALTAGKPTDITKAHISVEGTNGETQSFKASTTFSNGDYFIMTRAAFSVRKGSGAGAGVDFRILVRQPGSVFRPITGVITVTSEDGSFERDFYPYIIIPKNSDIYVAASTNTNTTEVSADFQGYLAAVQ